ncbi:MAG: PIN domain-containing protein [Dorea sp.]|jgi:predicted nucleic acid-binding protein|uniref:PIN domain-containing protein n=1 Tax=uncultured Phocaeicola sp. TaxID=990718 RepID=UPI00216CD976|nr:PIN domain-containing protein [uncultured Phocaeicola sp.]MCI8784354.1 PIN domain-containing protein [Dorea sp.]MCI9454648.1 PIN domain-containing protein [Dorea sp.]
MKLLIDTNILLDVLLKREPFYYKAVEVLELVQYDNVQEYVSAAAVTDIYYIAYKYLKDKGLVRQLLKKLMGIVSIAAVSEKEIEEALELAWNDFEDSVQYAVALLNEMDGIVTRNPKDYKRADMKVWSPEQVLQKFQDI